MHPHYEDTLRQVLAWANENSAIHAILVIGSQARRALPADQWSDLDLMLLVDEPRALLDDSTWLTRFGSPACTFAEIVPLHFPGWEWLVRRVLYSDQREVDFSLLPYAHLTEALEVNQDILSKGWQVLYDDSGGQLAAQLCARLPSAPQAAQPPLSPEQLQAVVSELLYHVIWAGKKIQRNELWVAVSCINCHMKELLLRLVEAHTAAASQRPNPLGYNGRFLEQRAAPATLDLLAGCFTRYDRREAVAALHVLYELTYQLASAICQQQGYPFDAAQFKRIQAMMLIE